MVEHYSKSPPLSSRGAPHVRYACALQVIFFILCNVLWEIKHGTLQSLHYYSKSQVNSQQEQATIAATTQQLPRDLKSNKSEVPQSSKQSAAYHAKKLDASRKKINDHTIALKESRKKRFPHRFQGNNIVTSSTAAMKKPVPAIMCVSPSCKIRSCLDSDNATAAISTIKNATHLPGFMRQFPDAHYGYGFVNREGPRGLRMQTSGSAKAGSGCAISHKYQFIFVHVLKSGGTTVKGFLQRALCGSNNCPAGDNNLEIVNCAASVAKYPHYFVFSFVRNPYARMYSAYAMADSFRGHKTRPKPPFSFEAFALGVQKAPNPDGSNNSAVEEVFPTGISSMQVEKIRRRRKKVANDKNAFRRHLSYLDPSHYLPQATFLFASGYSGCPVVDFIGHLETMHDDLETVLAYIDSPELWSYFHNQNNKTKAKIAIDESTAFGARQKEKEFGGNLQTAYGYQQQQPVLGGSNAPRKWSAIQKAVAEEYKRDFDLLGYDPNLVPS